MKTQSGYVMFFLIPVLAISLLVMASAYRIVDYYRKSKNACRHHLLKSQEHLADAMNRLTSLNSNADSLRLQEWNAQLQMASTAAFPPAYAAAVANYKRIRFQQLQLHRQQLSLLRISEQLTYRELSKAKQEIMSLGKVKLLLPNHKRLAVISKPPGTLAPSYYPASGFSHRQKITARWNTRIAHLLPRVFSGLFKDQPDMTLTCSSTIERKGNQWQSLLVADRF